MRIAFVVSRWGEPTQTFVRREAAAAISAGHGVQVVSLKSPVETGLDVQVVHLGWVTVVASLLRQLLRSPVPVARAVGRALVRSRWRTAHANLSAVAIGIAAAQHLRPTDWIHAHFNWVAGSAADALATVRSQPLSIFGHAFDLFDRRFIDRYAGDKLRRSTLVLVESERIAAETRERFGCHALVQRMGVPPDLVASNVPARTGDLVLSVGSLIAKKGHDDLIRAIAPTDLRLKILGDGDERPELEALARALGVAGRVEMPGAVSSAVVLSELDHAAVFCLASKPTPDGDRDGVPNVLIEAMARGVPVVSTRVSGIPDLLADGRGAVVDPGDVAALRSALVELCNDPERAVRLAEAALEHVRACYTTEVNWRQLEERMAHALHPPA